MLARNSNSPRLSRPPQRHRLRPSRARSLLRGCSNQKVIAAFDLAPAQRVPRAIGRVASVDEAVHQVLITAAGNAQARGLDNLHRGLADILDIQPRRVEALGIPHRHLQAQCLAQQGLAGAELLRGARTAVGMRIVQQHLCQAGRARGFIEPRIGRFDQDCRIIPVTPSLTGIQQCRV